MFPTSKERTNFARVCRAIIDVGTEVLRNTLEDEIDPKDIKLEINRNLRTAPARKRIVLLQDQQQKIDNALTDGYKDFDITLLYRCIKYLCTSTMKPTHGWYREGQNNLPTQNDVTAGDDIERIRDMRNKLYGHIPNTCVSDADFSDYWTTLKGIMVRMTSKLGKPYDQELDNIEIVAMDDQLEADYIKTMETLHELDKDIRNKVDDIKRRQSEMERKHSYEHHEIQKQVSATQNKVSRIEDRFDNEINPGISRSKLQSWIEEDKTFCKTKATKHIYDEAVKTGNIIVSGVPGAGKSANIHHIALRLRKEGHRVCCVHGLKKMVKTIDKFREEDKQVFVFDDVFGVHGVEENKRKEWSDENKEDVHRCFRNPNVIILCSSRIQVLNDDKVSYITSNFSVINISQGEYKLSVEEQVQIFKRHASVKQRYDLLTGKVTEKIRKICCRVGCFPLVCRLYIGDEETQRSIEEYFQKPLNVIAENLEKLRVEEPLRYVCLLICLIYDNNLPIDTIEVVEEGNERKKLREELLEVFELSRLTSRQEIKKKMDTLLRTYVKLDDDAYHFIHEIIHEAVIKHADALPSSVHKVILRHCSSKFMCNNVRLSTVRYKDSCINVRPDVYSAWGECVLRAIDEGIRQSGCLYEDINEKKCNKDNYPFRDDNPWRNVFRRNPCLDKEQGDIIVSKALSSKSPSDIQALMCTKGYAMRPGETHHSALHWAVWCGLQHTVEQTVKVISDITLQQVDSVDSLLCIAYESPRSNTEVIQTLILHRANVNTPCADGRTPLWRSLDKDDYNTAEKLLKYGADVNVQDILGNTLLWKSLENDDYKAIELLLQHGADVNVLDILGHTLLWRSLYNKRYKTAELLLKHGAEVNKPNANGCTPLWKSLDNEDYETADFLIHCGASVNAPDSNVHTELRKSVDKKNYRKVDYLIKNGADVNKPDAEDCTLLWKSVDNEDYEMADFLIRCGASANTSNSNAHIPLWKAAKKNDCKAIEFLIDRGADVNIVDREGLTPLCRAFSEHYHYRTAELLINHGADVNKPDVNGRTPLLMAFEFDKHSWAFERLSLPNFEFEIAKLLINHETDVNKSDANGRTPLLMILEYNNSQFAFSNIALEIAKLLIHHGADVNKSDANGRTPLLTALEHSSEFELPSFALEIPKFTYMLEIPKLLIHYGADVNKSDANGRTPLLTALEYNSSQFPSPNIALEIAKLLIHHGADVNKSDANGRTPLLTAFEYNRRYIVNHTRREIVQLLINHGADVNKSDSNGVHR